MLPSKLITAIALATMYAGRGARRGRLEGRRSLILILPLLDITRYSNKPFVNKIQIQPPFHAQQSHYIFLELELDLI